MAAKGRNHGGPVRLPTRLCGWARVLAAAIAVGAIPAAAHAGTLGDTAAPENSHLGLARNLGPALVGAERSQAPESPLESALAYGQLASDVPYATRGGAAAVRVGQAGEAAVRGAFNIGEKAAIQVAGRTRIPDGLTSTVLSEVKNVGSLSYTQQLRDFAQYAGQNGLRFDLYVRPSTQLSGPLSDAVQSGVINLRFIP